MPLCFIQLGNITQIRSFLLFVDLEEIVHAIISSRLNYGNVFYCGVTGKILMTAANEELYHWTSSRSKRSSHITPVLSVLHWLLVN